MLARAKKSACRWRIQKGDLENNCMDTALNLSDMLTPELIRVGQVALLTIGALLLERHLLKYAEKMASQTDNILDDALIESAKGPLTALIWISGIFFAARYADWHALTPILQYLPQVHLLCVVLCATWFMRRLILHYAAGYVEAGSKNGEKVDQTMVDGLSKLARITTIILSALMLMQILGLNISSLIAFGGVGGLAVGLAARDWVANLIGGLMVHLGRPFSVGETIRSPDRQIEGKVEMISWLQTRIRTPNMSVVFVPNSLFTTVVLENPSQITNRRIDQVIYLRHQDVEKVDAIVSEIRKILTESDEIDQDKAINVCLEDITDASLKLVVRAYTRTTDLVTFQAIKQSLLIRASEIISRHGASLTATVKP